MKLLDHTFLSPAENLACDEALLTLVEDGYDGEILRFWETDRYFVVLGSSMKIEQEIYVDRCIEDGIPIHRRHSGGGTVLQGPGCLNYSLVMKIDPDGPTRNITDTTTFVLRRHRGVVASLLGENVEIQGSSDLAIAGMKISGNAQRRRLNAVLFHGTFLLDFDLERIERYLKLPEKQPDYREQRTHVKFLRNIQLPSSRMKSGLQSVWNAAEPYDGLGSLEIQKLVKEKYSKHEWTYRM